MKSYHGKTLAEVSLRELREYIRDTAPLAIESWRKLGNPELAPETWRKVIVETFKKFARMRRVAQQEQGRLFEYFFSSGVSASLAALFTRPEDRQRWSWRSELMSSMAMSCAIIAWLEISAAEAVEAIIDAMPRGAQVYDLDDQVFRMRPGVHGTGSDRFVIAIVHPDFPLIPVGKSFPPAGQVQFERTATGLKVTFIEPDARLFDLYA